jgi:hypothetical protein
MNQSTFTPITYNVIYVNSIVIFTHTKAVSADISFLYELNVSNGTNLTEGAGCH